MAFFLPGSLAYDVDTEELISLWTQLNKAYWRVPVLQRVTFPWHALDSNSLSVIPKYCMTREIYQSLSDGDPAPQSSFYLVPDPQVNGPCLNNASLNLPITISACLTMKVKVNLKHFYNFRTN